MCSSRNSTHICSLFFFRAFLSLFRWDHRANVYQAVAKEKRKIRRGWDFFLRRFSCGFGGISYTARFNDLALFSVVFTSKQESSIFANGRDTRRLFTWPQKILDSVAYVASVFLLSIPNGWSMSVKPNDIFAGLIS